MRIGIITITEGENLGNRLQNYAVQECLKKYKNVEVETIHNYKNQKIKSYKIGEVKRKIKTYVKVIVGYKRKENCNFLKRLKKFKKFNKKNIKYSKFSISNVEINENINKDYDYFICGSDQIWNSDYKENSHVNFLQFADATKRIAFSPSFGTSSINSNMKDDYSKWLKEIPKLSVREERGKEIIKELTGRQDVEVLVDPTMLLTSEEWNKVSQKPKELNTNKFVLNYFLGELSKERATEIERIANENNCQIINIFDMNSPFYAVGPSEFLYLEKNAFLICTDSFHSCVFAMLYKRPFIVFDREDSNVKMNSRLETLLDKFDLKDRWFSGKLRNEQLKLDYTNTYDILEKERKKANGFLIKALNIES